MDTKNILIAPISGINFINQLTSYLNLCDYDFRPDICLCASGGALTTTIAIVSDFDATAFKRNVQEINSCEFVSSWVPECVDFIPSWIVGFFQGALYKHSITYPHKFRKFVVPPFLRDNELWVMAYSMDEKRAALFCSTSEEKAFLQRCHHGCSIIQSNLFTFLDGDVDTFADAVIASSSVPTIVPPKLIEGKYYADGGIVYASPFTPFRNQIEDLESFHLIYVNGSDLDDNDFSLTDPEFRTIVDTADVTTTAIVKSYLIQDRYACYILIKSKGDVIHRDISLQEYFEEKDTWQYSLLEMYPTVHQKVDITSFTGQELYEKMTMHKDDIGCRVWYVERDNLTGDGPDGPDGNSEEES